MLALMLTTGVFALPAAAEITPVKVVTLDSGDEHVIGLKEDGTVIAAGYNDMGQCNVSKWTDIVCISAGRYSSMGLKADGTVVSTADKMSGGDVSKWTDIVAIAAGSQHSVGLRSDGTVVAKAAMNAASATFPNGEISWTSQWAPGIPWA